LDRRDRERQVVSGQVGARLIAAVVAFAVACGSVTFAQAQSQPGLAQAQSGSPDQSPADIVKMRQRGLKKLGAAFKVLRDELQGGSPDAAKIRSASADITQAAGAIASWFPTGTGPAAGVKTDAKAEVWTDTAGFAAARDLFVREANRWAQLGSDGNPAAWNEAAVSLGQSCRGCHDKYRVKRE
jgi:cytochrome c556